MSKKKNVLRFLASSIMKALFVVVFLGILGLFPMTDRLVALILFILLLLNDGARELLLTDVVYWDSLKGGKYSKA